MTTLIVVFFIAYIIIVSIIPNLLMIDVSDETKQKTEQNNFTSNTLGPDRASIVIDSAEALNIRLEMVREAKESIDIVMYKIMDSESTKAFFGEVYEAAKRGVKVNITVNGLTYLFYRNQSYLKALSAHSNIIGRLYNPVNLFKPLTLQNLMHDKIILVDNTYLLLGGRNIDERHFRPIGFDKPIAYDNEIFVVNTKNGSKIPSVLPEVCEYIEEIYRYKLTKRVKGKKKDPYILQMLNVQKTYSASNPQFYRRSLEDFINQTVSTNKITLIHNPINAKKKEPTLGYQLKQLALKAKNSVIVQTPYVTGNKEILQGFEEVAEQVELTIQTNSLASTPNVFAFSNYYGHRRKINKTGANIFEFQSYDSVHNKSVIIDDRIAVIGTFNMDDRSLYINSEVMLVVDSKELTEEFTRNANAFLEQSLKLNGNNAYFESDKVEKLPVSLTKKIIINIHFVLLRGIQFLL